MADQQYNRSSVGEPEARRSTSDSSTEVKEPVPHLFAHGLWRFLIIFALIVLGVSVGYQIGVIFVTYINNATDGSTGSWSSLLNTFFTTHPGARQIDEFLFAGIGGLVGFLVGSSAYNKISALSENVRGMRANEKIALFLGIAAGLILTLLLGELLIQIPKIGWLLTIFVGVICVYVCTAGTLSMKDTFRLGRALHDSDYTPSAGGEPTSTQIKILDTNVIIDGRVSDVCATGFIEGAIYVPGFVLDELQHIADSSDSLKRARGRRGLDILNQMRRDLPLVVRTLDAKADLPPNEEVDSKLVKLAKKLGGAIVTNDFNLNKVAELQGVPVLNINELANALKPVVLPGEEMSVAVIKEGKEMNQGIGYLDDGTMIVIEGARRRIGDTLEVVVSSVLQTVAGKMIFATLKSSHDEGYEPDNGDGSSDQGQGPRPYSGGRTRRPFR